MEHSRNDTGRRKKAIRTARLTVAILFVCVVGLALLFSFVPALSGRVAPAEGGAPVNGSKTTGPVASDAAGALDADLLADLTALLPAYPALAPVLDAPQRYPESLLRLFLVNPEVLETLLLYPEWDTDTPGAITADEIAGSFPHLMQWDPRWAYLPYGEDMIAVTGCGPVCLSAVAIHLTGDATCSPAAVAAWAQAGGYYQPGTGSTWALMAEGGAAFGLSSTELPLDKGHIYSALRAGSPIICSMRQGDFTTANGHFVVLTAVDEVGNITIHDPARNVNSARTWTYDEIEHQIKNLWAFSLAR